MCCIAQPPCGGEAPSPPDVAGHAAPSPTDESGHVAPSAADCHQILAAYPGASLDAMPNAPLYAY